MDLARHAAASEARTIQQPSHTMPVPAGLTTSPAAANTETLTHPAAPRAPTATTTFRHYSQIVLQSLTMAAKLGAELDRSRHYLLKLQAWEAKPPLSAPPSRPTAHTQPKPQPVPHPQNENPFPSLMETITAELAARPPPR